MPTIASHPHCSLGTYFFVDQETKQPSRSPNSSTCPACKGCVIYYATPDGNLYPFGTYISGPCHREEIERQFSIPWTEDATGFRS